MVLLTVSVLCVLVSVIAEFVGTFWDLDRRTALSRLDLVFEEGGEVFALVFFLTLQYHVLAHQGSLRISFSPEVDEGL